MRRSRAPVRCSSPTSSTPWRWSRLAPSTCGWSWSTPGVRAPGPQRGGVLGSATAVPFGDYGVASNHAADRGDGAIRERPAATDSRCRASSSSGGAARSLARGVMRSRERARQSPARWRSAPSRTTSDEPAFPRPGLREVRPTPPRSRRSPTEHEWCPPAARAFTRTSRTPSALALDHYPPREADDRARLAARPRSRAWVANRSNEVIHSSSRRTEDRGGASSCSSRRTRCTCGSRGS
jgi:hypothetical protein